MYSKSFDNWNIWMKVWIEAEKSGLLVKTHHFFVSKWMKIYGVHCLKNSYVKYYSRCPQLLVFDLEQFAKGGTRYYLVFCI